MGVDPEYNFEVTKALATNDTLVIGFGYGTEEYTNVTDAASIVKKINENSSSSFTAVAAGEVITLTQNWGSGTPSVSVKGVDAVQATPAKFKFEVTKALATTDTLVIGTEEYTNVTDAASIVKKINENSSSSFTAVAAGEVITLTQKVAAAGATPTVKLK